MVLAGLRAVAGGRGRGRQRPPDVRGRRLPAPPRAQHGRQPGARREPGRLVRRARPHLVRAGDRVRTEGLRPPRLEVRGGRDRVQHLVRAQVGHRLDEPGPAQPGSTLRLGGEGGGRRRRRDRGAEQRGRRVSGGPGPGLAAGRRRGDRLEPDGAAGPQRRPDRLDRRAGARRAPPLQRSPRCRRLDPLGAQRRRRRELVHARRPRLGDLRRGSGRAAGRRGGSRRHGAPRLRLQRGQRSGRRPFGAPRQDRRHRRAVGRGRHRGGRPERLGGARPRDRSGRRQRRGHGGGALPGARDGAAVGDEQRRRRGVMARADPAGGRRRGGGRS